MWLMVMLSDNNNTSKNNNSDTPVYHNALCSRNVFKTFFGWWATLAVALTGEGVVP